MNQLSLKPVSFFQRYAPDKLFIAKIKKVCYSVNTGDMVKVLKIRNSPMVLYQCITFRSITFNTFRDMPRTKVLRTDCFRAHSDIFRLTGAQVDFSR